jgi:hypothetical protein
LRNCGFRGLNDHQRVTGFDFIKALGNDLLDHSAEGS